MAVAAGFASLCSAQSARAQDDLGLQIETRFGFLVSFADGHADRPLAAVDLGYALIDPRPGGPPGLTLTGGVGVGFAEFFADTQSESFRVMAGVQVPWALATRGPDHHALQLVPHLQAGLLTSNGGDEREGFVLRAAVGLRVPMGSDGMHFTFEPVALVRLPDVEFVPAVGAPSTAFESPDPAWALELGVFKLGWRF